MDLHQVLLLNRFKAVLWMLLFTCATRSSADEVVKCKQIGIKGTTNVAAHCTVSVLTVNFTDENIPFNTTTNLTISCLHHSEFSQIDRKTFRLFIYLERLVIVHCEFEHFPEEAFQGLKNLRYLRVENFQRSKTEIRLPSSFSKDLFNVKTLFLNGVGMEVVPKSFWINLPNITSVSFVLNSIAELKWLEGFANRSSPKYLSYLDLTKNSLTKLLPYEFESVPRLLILRLRSNYLRSIHETAFHGLQALQLLDLGYNELTGLTPYIFKSLVSLQSLNLNGNEIEHLPADIFSELTNLVNLNLYGNYFSLSDPFSLPFRNLHQLRSLTLGENNISSMPDRIFEHLSNLRDLSLRRNDLYYINSSVFAFTQKLEWLIIESCSLLSSEFLLQLPSLKRLYANDNKLMRPKHEHLVKCQDLQHIDLGATGMTSLEVTESGVRKGMFTDFKKLKTLKVNKNAFGFFDYSMIPNSLNLVDLSHAISSISDEFNTRNGKNLTSITLDQNKFSEWNTHMFGSRTQKIYCSDCVVKIIKSCTFCKLKRLKNVVFWRSKLENVERFAFREKRIGAPTISPEIKFDSSICILAADWIVSHINFIHIKSPHSKHVCQRTTRCRHTRTLPTLGFTIVLPLDNVAESVILDCGNNNMTSFSLGPEDRGSVNYLYLDMNRFYTIKNGTFYNMTSVQYFFLNSSYVTALEPDAFAGLTELTELYLHNNKLSYINERQFMYQIELSKLWLQNNCISSLDRSDFARQTLLKELRLENNLIVSLQGSEFLRLSSLTRLYLNNNNLTHVATLTFRKQHELQELHLENNSLNSLPPRLFFGARKLDILYLNDNKFRIVQNTTFAISLKLRILHLDDNSISEIEPLGFQNLGYLRELHLQHNLLETFHSHLFSANAKLKVLGLSHNKLLEIHSHQFSDTGQLESLFLDNNNLSTLDTNSLSSLKYLKNITLHNNQLYEIAVWKLPLSLQRITLSGNELSCDCSFLVPFQNWVLAYGHNKVPDIENVICRHQNGTRATLPILQHTQRYCQMRTSLLIPLLATGGSFVVIVIVAILGYMHRLEMQVWLYSRYGVRLFYPQDDADEGRAYHAFVAFSSEDEEFVAYHLVPGLEPIGFKLCIHTRDFPIGAIITSTVCEVVENSCRTLLVLSNNFVNSEWCKFEFKMAHFQTIHDKCCRLIVIILEDVDVNTLDKELKVYLKTNTYLRWGDPYFWEKLRFAMPNIEHLAEVGERQPLLQN